MAGKNKAPKTSAAPRKAEAKPVVAKAVAAKAVAAKAAVPKATAAKAAVNKSAVAKVAKPVTKAAVKKLLAAAIANAPRKASGMSGGTTGEKPRKAKKSEMRKGREIRKAKFAVGQIVRHRIYPFRGVVFDIDPIFANTEEWWMAIPADVRPKKDQPYYHLLAENAETEYIAYVSEQNLLRDDSGVPLRHPGISDYFVENDDGTLRSVHFQSH